MDYETQSACVTITGIVPDKLTYSPNSYKGFENLPDDASFVIVNATTSNFVVNNVPRITYVWDIFTSQLTQKTMKGSSVPVNYQSRQDGTCWFSRWSYIQSTFIHSTPDPNMVFIVIINLPETNQIISVIDQFDEAYIGDVKSRKTCSNVRTVLWNSNETFYFDPSESRTITDTKDIVSFIWKDKLPYNYLFNYIISESGNLSKIFSYLFGSVCYEEDKRQFANVTLPLPDNITIPDGTCTDKSDYMKLVHSTHNIHQLTVGGCSHTLKFNLSHVDSSGEKGWSITFIGKLVEPRKLDRFTLTPVISVGSQDVNAIRYLRTIISTTSNEFDPSSIYNMMKSAGIFVDLFRCDGLRHIWNNCITRANVTWSSEYDQYRMGTGDKAIPPIAPMRTQSCIERNDAAPIQYPSMKLPRRS